MTSGRNTYAHARAADDDDPPSRPRRARPTVRCVDLQLPQAA